MDKKLYKINEFAGKCSVSARTLKYYEELGLLKPYLIVENGYRYYTLDQVDRVSSILLYQGYGFSLNEISEMITDADLPSHFSNLLTQKELVRKEMEKLQYKQQLIDYSLQFFHEFQNHPNEIFEKEADLHLSVYPIVKRSDETIYINYLSDGVHSGGVIDGLTGQVKGYFREGKDEQVHLKGKWLLLYSDNNSANWHEMAQQLRQYAESRNYPVSEVYFEGLIENYETNIFLNKSMMFVSEGEHNGNQK